MSVYDQLDFKARNKRHKRKENKSITFLQNLLDDYRRYKNEKLS